MTPHELEDIEIGLLLEAVFRRYGHDFRHYARATTRRRVRQFIAEQGLARIADAVPTVLHDPEVFQRLVMKFSISVTEMFRDPEVFLFLRTTVVPYLKTYPFIRVWHAGCATGEEVYSLAILLKEEGLYDRATIFATDFNDTVLERAREGLFPLSQMRQNTVNYQLAGGRRQFSDYFRTGFERAIMDQSLKERITFANHNLVTDGVFSEVHLALCRNVLIYFDRALQDRVVGLLADSLVRGGFLVLGSKETLGISGPSELFAEMEKKWKVYQRQGP